MNILNIIHIVFLILTLFFVGRGIFFGLKLKRNMREQYPKAIDF